VTDGRENGPAKIVGAGRIRMEDSSNAAYLPAMYGGSVPPSSNRLHHRAGEVYAVILSALSVLKFHMEIFKEITVTWICDDFIIRLNL
jgi:hypothetical protein